MQNLGLQVHPLLEQDAYFIVSGQSPDASSDRSSSYDA